jgi:hypothetical protein
MPKAILLIPALGAVMLSACASSTPHLDYRFGQAVDTAKAMQTLNPDASRNPDPVAGLDGAAARESIDRYRESFKAPVETFEALRTGDTR